MSRLLVFAFLILSYSFFSCSNEGDKSEESKEKAPQSMLSAKNDPVLTEAQKIFSVLPEGADFNSPMAVLGKELYYETALSVNNELSCNSCHLLDKYGVDNEATSPGHEGKRGDRNSPTVYNSDFHLAQFWDGRAADLIEQAKGPILNPIEMGLAKEEDAVNRIRAIEKYDQLFKNAFPSEKGEINYENIAKAIAGFEECLHTPAKWDEYLAGDIAALDNKEKEGLSLFIETGCTTCHTGPGLGGNMFNKFGLMNGPYWDYTGSEMHDEGRFAHTGKEFEKYFFKVPSLRNIEKTSPYFHDGSVESLEKAIVIMAKTQNDKDLDEEQVELIMAFLKSLTGEIPAEALLVSN